MTQCSSPETSKGTLLSTTTTNGIHCHGPHWRIPTRQAEDVVMAYLKHICCIFGPSKKILTDNGSEFKNKMWDEVFKD